MRRLFATVADSVLLLAACTSTPDGTTETTSAADPGGIEQEEDPGPDADPAGGETVVAFTVTDHGTFDEGWAMAFLPGADHLLISERGGALQLRNQQTGEVREVSGSLSDSDAIGLHHRGQAGMHDVIPGPSFERDGTIYVSWVRSAPGGAQGVVARATLDLERATVEDLEVLWEQTPTSGDGHFSLRLLVHDDHLFVTSGDRQKLDPAQDLDTNLGKVLRLTLDGEPAPGNPWESEGGVAAEFWTIGHRNPLGIAEDSSGNIWVSEMGPQGGDELNLLEAGANYGWPEASMGVHYGGGAIPDHVDGDGFTPPSASWVPSISPGSLAIHDGGLFIGWEDSALVGGLSGERIVRLELHPDGTAEQVQEWPMGARIRAVDVAPNGSLWILEDGAGGRLLELRPE